MERKTGLAPLPTGLLRPTTPEPTPPEPEVNPNDIRVDQAEPVAESDGAGEAPAPRPRKAAAKRKGEPRKAERQGRKFVISDRVFTRVQLLAVRRGTTVSAVVEELLEENLPKLRIEG